jgi:hypothetical protein
MLPTRATYAGAGGEQLKTTGVRARRTVQRRQVAKVATRRGITMYVRTYDGLEQVPATAPLSTPFPTQRLAVGPEAQLIQNALRQGIRDVNRLTNLVFYARHPGQRDRPLRQSEQPLVRKWLDIRDRIVRPVLGQESTTQLLGQKFEQPGL